MANRTAMRRGVACVGIAAAIVLGTVRAFAAPVLTVDVTTVGGYSDYTASPTAVEITNPDGTPTGTYRFSDYGYATGSFGCNWSAIVNPDPSITSTFTLTNLSSATQTFIMTITLPIAPLGPTTRQGGYFGDPVTGTVYTDVNGTGGVTLATVGGNPFYQALVNGIVSQNLGSFSVSASSGSGALSQQLWGTPIPSAPFGPASGNIQIKWTFSLTGGDQVSSKGFFQVEAPEPSSALLIGLGLAGLVAARKRARLV